MNYKSEISRCPYCASTSGFQIVTPLSGSYVDDYDFKCDIEVGEYSEGMNYYKSKTPVCRVCFKSLGRWIKIINE